MISQRIEKYDKNEKLDSLSDIGQAIFFVKKDKTYKYYNQKVIMKYDGQEIDLDLIQEKFHYIELTNADQGNRKYMKMLWNIFIDLCMNNPNHYTDEGLIEQISCFEKIINKIELIDNEKNIKNIFFDIKQNFDGFLISISDQSMKDLLDTRDIEALLYTVHFIKYKDLIERDLEKYEINKYQLSEENMIAIYNSKLLNEENKPYDKEPEYMSAYSNGFLLKMTECTVHYKSIRAIDVFKMNNLYRKAAKILQSETKSEKKSIKP